MASASACSLRLTDSMLHQRFGQRDHVGGEVQLCHGPQCVRHPADGSGRVGREHAELVALRVGEHRPRDRAGPPGTSHSFVAPAARKSCGSPYTSQCSRFFTVFGSGTGPNTHASNGIPGTSSSQHHGLPSSRWSSTPKTSAHHRRSRRRRRSRPPARRPCTPAPRRVAHERAQLVALRVGHHRPAVLVVLLRAHARAQGVRVSIDVGVQVEVHPVLHGLRLGHPADRDAHALLGADDVAGVGRRCRCGCTSHPVAAAQKRPTSSPSRRCRGRAP